MFPGDSQELWRTLGGLSAINCINDAGAAVPLNPYVSGGFTNIVALSSGAGEGGSAISCRNDAGAAVPIFALPTDLKTFGTPRQTERRTDKQADTQTDMYTARQADRQTDRHTDRRTDKQTDK